MTKIWIVYRITTSPDYSGEFHDTQEKETLKAFSHHLDAFEYVSALIDTETFKTLITYTLEELELV